MVVEEGGGDGIRHKASVKGYRPNPTRGPKITAAKNRGNGTRCALSGVKGANGLYLGGEVRRRGKERFAARSLAVSQRWANPDKRRETNLVQMSCKGERGSVQERE